MELKWVGLLLVTAALAGCSDDGGSSESPESSDPLDPDPSDPGNITTPPPSTNQPPSGNASFESNTTWTYDNRTGSVTGTILISDPPQEEESITVRAETRTMFLNLTVDSGELSMKVSAPSCEDESCQTDVTVSGGQASFEQQQPEQGEWTVILTAEGSPGPVDATYTLEVALEVPE